MLPCGSLNVPAPSDTLLSGPQALQVPIKRSLPAYPPTFAHQSDISGGSGCTHVQAWLPNGAATIQGSRKGPHRSKRGIEKSGGQKESTSGLRD